jgi:hypothetical protein
LWIGDQVTPVGHNLFYESPQANSVTDATPEATHQGEYGTRALLLLRDSKGAPANWLRSKKSGIDQVGGGDEAMALPSPCRSQLP